MRSALFNGFRKSQLVLLFSMSMCCQTENTNVEIKESYISIFDSELCFAHDATEMFIIFV